MIGVSRNTWPADVLTGLAVYAFTALPVLLGVIIATTPGVLVHNGPPPDFLHGCCHFDGTHFASVMDNGYSYDPANASTAAFFPGYPLAAEGVRSLTGCPTLLALVVTSNVAFVAALVLLSAYLRVRYQEEPLTSRLTVLRSSAFGPPGTSFAWGIRKPLPIHTGVVLLGLAAVADRGSGVRGRQKSGIRPVGVAATAAVTASFQSRRRILC